MSIKLTKALTILGEVSLGTAGVIGGKHLMLKKSITGTSSKEELSESIDKTFENMCEYISELAKKGLLEKIKYTLPDETDQWRNKDNFGFQEICKKWINYWKNIKTTKHLSFSVDFKEKLKDNENNASHEIVCLYNSKIYRLSLIFNKDNKAKYEDVVIWGIEKLDPLVKELEKMHFQLVK